MSNKQDNNEVILGAGELYMYEFNGDKMPTHAEIETDEHNVAHCSGGFKVEYKPTKHEVKNQYGQTIKTAITKEDITTKTGILTWDLEKMSLLSTAKFTKEKGIEKLTFGGKSKLKTVLVRFVHTKDDDKKIRFSMVGQAGNGFHVEFGCDKELTIDAEINAIQFLSNFLAEFEEEKEEQVVKA